MMFPKHVLENKNDIFLDIIKIENTFDNLFFTKITENNNSENVIDSISKNIL